MIKYTKAFRLRVKTAMRQICKVRSKSLKRPVIRRLSKANIAKLH